jgi:hypothetical protein
MYSDLRAHARHAEALRANAVNVVLVVASALVTVITSDGHVQRDELPACFDPRRCRRAWRVIRRVDTELDRRNWRRAMRLRDLLDERYFSSGDPTIEEMVAASDRVPRDNLAYRLSRGLTGSAQRFWLGIPALVVVADLVLVAMAL